MVVRISRSLSPAAPTTNWVVWPARGASPRSASCFTQRMRPSMPSSKVLLAGDAQRLAASGASRFSETRSARRDRRLHLGELGARHDLQVQVAGVAVAPPQDLGGGQQAVHGVGRAAGDGRAEEDALHLAAGQHLHEGAGQLIGREGDTADRALARVSSSSSRSGRRWSAVP